MSAWESDILKCKKCIHCNFRAERDKDTCCSKCTASGACELLDHTSECPRLSQEALERCYWECVNCDENAREDAKCLVVPSHTEGPSPVLLFLTGNGHVDDRQDFYNGGVDQLMRNNDLKSFTILAPKPLSWSGVMRRNEKWRAIWCEDGLWAMLTEILRRLGPQKVDARRIYVTGLSLGATGAWHLALRYGEYLAGVAPVSGVCNWPFGAWPRRCDPKEEVLKQLQNLPLRAYQIDVDGYGGSPKKDMEWLCWGTTLHEEDKNLRGMEIDTRVDVSVKRWERPHSTWELWEARGPLKDWNYNQEWGDKHCLWQRVYPWPEWGLAAFFTAQLPEGKCWDLAKASPLSKALAKVLEDEEKWKAEQAEQKRQAEEREAQNAQNTPMEVDTEPLSKMSTGDMEVMQEQKRLRQDDERGHALSVGV